MRISPIDGGGVGGVAMRLHDGTLAQEQHADTQFIRETKAGPLSLPTVVWSRVSFAQD